MDEIISYKTCAVKVRNAKLRNYLKWFSKQLCNCSFTQPRRSPGYEVDCELTSFRHLPPLPNRKITARYLFHHSYYFYWTIQSEHIPSVMKSNQTHISNQFYCSLRYSNITFLTKSPVHKKATVSTLFSLKRKHY